MIFLFTSTQSALQAEEALLDEGVEVDVIPKPPAVEGLCGIALELREDSGPAAVEVLEDRRIPFELYEDDEGLPGEGPRPHG